MLLPAGLAIQSRTILPTDELHEFQDSSSSSILIRRLLLLLTANLPCLFPRVLAISCAATTSLQLPPQ
jgi:hypothetical protein